MIRFTTIYRMAVSAFVAGVTRTRLRLQTRLKVTKTQDSKESRHIRHSATGTACVDIAI